jgi:hypothetical protein
MGFTDNLMPADQRDIRNIIEATRKNTIKIVLEAIKHVKWSMGRNNKLFPILTRTDKRVVP